jgi:hypothetical protein
MAITGMLVELVTTTNKGNAGTDDEIYIGMWGRAGGREFSLSSSAIKNFKQGSDPIYELGISLNWGFPPVRSASSEPGHENDPALIPIELDGIEYVYVRKQAYGTGGDDDAWQADSVVVMVYDTDNLPFRPTQLRMFGLDADPQGLWFGNEFGHQAWLTEAASDSRVFKSLREKAGLRPE